MAVLRPLKVVIENYPEGQSEELEAVNHPDDPAAGTRKHPLRPRALYRARRLHGEPAEEILPAVARQGGAAALRLFHHLPRGGEERGRRGGRAALHLRSGDARRQRAGRPQGEGDASTGCRRRMRCRRRCGSTIRCSRGPTRTPATSPPISIRNRSKCSTDARVEPALAGGNAGEAVQFERQGYFCRDADSTAGPARCSTAPSACATPGPRCRAGRAPEQCGHGPAADEQVALAARPAAACSHDDLPV